MGALLELDRVSKRFGGLTAVRDLSFHVEEGEIRGLIGPNGAGKTTTFNVISGFYRPTSGSIRYRGRTISGLGASRIAEDGLVRTFQSTTLFHEMTVFENMLVGCHLQARTGLFAALFGLDGPRRRAAEARALQVLRFLGLEQRRDDVAANLPHGLQKALGLGIALAGEPKLLLLDEPFAGMNSEETRTMMGLVRRIREEGVTILLVEHDMQAVMGLCDRITVLNFGVLLAEGSPQEIRAHPEVVEAYLGTA
ncbi:MAG TPA: ABC transporter ATP-binding protein [Alphaproteobacteria bacterium]|nr:ABC transporter ATP-binding protein [Alphaproteobacteria bacterium]